MICVLPHKGSLQSSWVETQATKFNHIYFYKMCFGLQREPLARILYITVIHISAITDLWNLSEAWTYSGYFWEKVNAAIFSSICLPLQIAS